MSMQICWTKTNDFPATNDQFHQTHESFCNMCPWVHVSSLLSNLLSASPDRELWMLS